MKKVVKIVSFCLLILAIGTTSSYGQGSREEMKEVLENSTPEQRADTLTAIMTTELDLTEEQIPKVQEVNFKYAQKAEELKASTENRKTKFKSVKSMDKEKDADIKAVLTVEQYKEYQDKKKKMMKEMVDRLS